MTVHAAPSPAIPMPIPAPARGFVAREGGDPPPPTQPSADERAIAASMTATGVMEHIGALATVPRPAGSPEYGRAVDYVLAQAAKSGWTARVVEQKSPWGSTVRNVVADRSGTGPDGQRGLVIAGAHLDTVRRAPGANDNGSGSSTLLEIAEALNGHPTPNDIRLIWFDREEEGLVGSSTYARSNADELKRAVRMINMDMVGSPKGKVQFSLGTHTPNALADEITGVARRNGLDVTFLTEHHNRSDHAAFDAAGVPAADFGPSVRDVEAEDPNYHSSRDTPDKINQTVLEGFGDLLALEVYDAGGRMTRPSGPSDKPGKPITGPPR